MPYAVKEYIIVLRKAGQLGLESSLPGQILAWSHIKVRKRAKIRNQYNQAPHLTRDTNGKVTTSQIDTTNESKRSALSQQVTTRHQQTDVHESITKQDRNNTKDPQKKPSLGTVAYF